MKLFLLIALLIGTSLAGKSNNNNSNNNNNSGSNNPAPESPTDDTSDDSSDTESATCSDGSCDLCGTMTSYVESISGDARVISVNGCPHHYSICTGKCVVPGCGDIGEEGSSTEATEQCVDYTVPAYPVLRTGSYSVA